MKPLAQTFPIVIFSLSVLIGCTPHTIHPEKMRGCWMSESNEPLGMNQTIEISEPDSLASYDPAAGDTIFVFDGYRIKSDTIIFHFQGKTNFKCKIEQLDDSILILRGLPGREEESVKFIINSKAKNNLSVIR